MEEPAGPSNKCIFCENYANSREDIFPNWINGAFEMPDGWSYDKLILSIGSKQKPPQGKIATKQTAVRCVCKPCNNGWMSQLENEVKPILTPLMNGHCFKLEPQDQLTLARWVCLKAVCYDANPRASSPPLSSEQARTTIQGGVSELVVGRAPENWTVWLGTYPRTALFSCMPFAIADESRRSPASIFTFTMCIGFTVLTVQGRTGDWAPSLFERPLGYDLSDSQQDHSPPMVTLYPPRPGPIEIPLSRSLAPLELCAALTVGLPQPYENDEVERVRSFIRSHEEERLCANCDEVHARYPVADLPIRPSNRVGLPHARN